MRPYRSEVRSGSLLISFGSVLLEFGDPINSFAFIESESMNLGRRQCRSRDIR